MSIVEEAAATPVKMDQPRAPRRPKAEYVPSAHGATRIGRVPKPRVWLAANVAGDSSESESDSDSGTADAVEDFDNALFDQTETLDGVSRGGTGEAETAVNGIIVPAGKRIPTLDDPPPRTYNEAMEGEFGWLWRPAVVKEINNHTVVHHTWELTTLPPGRRVIKSKWCFDYKFHGGVFVKAKARFVACGYSQMPGIDFNETFAGTPRWDSVRLMLAIQAAWGLSREVADYVAAYLNANVKEDLYVEQPLGFVVTGRNGVRLYLHMLRSLYGLVQSGNNWSNRRNVIFKSVGLTQSIHDECVFFRRGIKPGEKGFVALCVHVDDSLMIGKGEDIRGLREELNKLIKLEVATDNYYLGAAITDIAGGIKMDHTKYIMRMLVTHDMQDCKGVMSPMDKTKLTKATADTLIDENIRPLVGSLRFVVLSRPDIAFAVGCVSRYVNSPTKEVVAACKRILRYLKGTIDKGLVYKGNGGRGWELHGYVDADLAGDINDRRSTTGYVFCMNKFSSPIAFYSGVQHCVATSTAHSEMLAVAKAVVMVIHLRELLDELSLGEIDATALYEDNSAVVAMSQNAINGSATMHFAIKSAFVREQIKAGVCCLVKIGALEQAADVLTKALTGDLFYKLRAYIVADCAGELAPRAHHA